MYIILLWRVVVVVVVKPFHPPELMVVGEFKHNLCGRMQYEHRTNTASLYAEALWRLERVHIQIRYTASMIGSPNPSDARPNRIGKSIFFPGHVIHSRPRVRGGRLYMRWHTRCGLHRMSAFPIPLQVLHQYVGAMSHTLASPWAYRVCQIINWWVNAGPKRVCCIQHPLPEAEQELKHQRKDTLQLIF